MSYVRSHQVDITKWYHMILVFVFLTSLGVISLVASVYFILNDVITIIGIT